MTNKIKEKELRVFIKEKREEKGFSLNALAKHIGTSPSTLSRYESGEIKDLKSQLMENIFNTFQLSISERSEAIQADILFQAPKNMELKETNNLSCSVCLSEDELMDMELGHRNQIHVSTLCKECRVKLFNKLAETI